MRILRAGRAAIPTTLRASALGLALVAAVVLQGAVLARLGLPGGPPPLVLVVVVAAALGTGPAAGAATGFAAGLLLDLAPGGTAVVGEAALALTLVGGAVGTAARRVAGRDGRTPLPTALAVAAAAAVAAVLLGALEALVLARPARAGPTWDALLASIPAQTVYAAVLALAAVPLQQRLARRRRRLRLRLAPPVPGGTSGALSAALDRTPPDVTAPGLAEVTVLPVPPRAAQAPAADEELDLTGPGAGASRRRDAS